MSTENDAINDQKVNDVSADEQGQTADDQQQSAEKSERPALSPREQKMEEARQKIREADGRDVPLPEELDDDAENQDNVVDGENDNRYADDQEQETAGSDAGGDEDGSKAAAQKDPLEELGYYRKPDGKLYTTVKVNGEQREVEASQVKAYIQKDLAGDFKLQQAASRERDLLERERKLQEIEGKLRTASNHPPSQGDDEIRQQAKDVLKSLFDGDDDAAAEKLAAFIQSNRGQQVNTDEILTQADQRFQARLEQQEAASRQKAWNSSLRDGMTWLRENHPKVLEDSELRDYVDSKTERMVTAQQNGDPEYADMTPRDIIERAATEVNEWLEQFGAGGQSSAPGNQREERKRNLKPIPKGMTNQPTRKPPAPEPDNSPAAAIAKMRKARGF